MAHVPTDAEWFLAQMVLEIRVAGSKRNVVHVNLVLIHAGSPEAAFKRAISIGKRGNSSYVNGLGKRVTVRFRGLRELDVIHDPLEDGCEVMFTERLGVTEKGIRKLLRPKRDLEVFLPVRDRPGRPNFGSKEVMDQVKRELSIK